MEEEGERKEKRRERCDAGTLNFGDVSKKRLKKIPFFEAFVWVFLGFELGAFRIGKKKEVLRHCRGFGDEVDSTK